MRRLLTYLFPKWSRIHYCNHDWKLFMEHYPTYAKDWWKCNRCETTKVFASTETPVPTTFKLCSQGHVHLVEK